MPEIDVGLLADLLIGREQAQGHPFVEDLGKDLLVCAVHVRPAGESAGPDLRTGSPDKLGEDLERLGLEAEQSGQVAPHPSLEETNADPGVHRRERHQITGLAELAPLRVA